MSGHIRKLIEEGEHQRLDFKFEVSDFRKIARTLVAFSNTDGGRLLIGVKDNGSIAGVRSEEEFFMLDGAAKLYCRPEVSFRIKEWNVEGKKVLEATIEPGKDKPYRVHDNDSQWRAYIRQGDQNFKADELHVLFWERKKKGQQTTIRYREAERIILKYLERHTGITREKFEQIGGVTAEQAGEILVSYLMLGLLEPEYSESGVKFRLRRGHSDFFNPDVTLNII